ncbi:sigma-70 family RNA polymerase sigma factor [Glycomyces harbinensis]|uniref:RNA polymerase sigma-70 factor, ECF subfamily n=1 Tax=Glycomyces harbinensis TaxID=58114 RepID=A0A1G6XCB1_9ACTN|nr:sigma-70 family RNA polymerase sigma factor [Glycomyces harbinensis]SDD75849.1 RNA polymerase sigma-70 factor, ECF subfamily [Glycomyces harbinensis]
MSLTAGEVDQFEACRPRLAALAYRLLGSASDAEDAVQDAFLRWAAVDRDEIRTPEAWLTKALTNGCLDRLSSARARRERSFGQWLPEPVLDGDPLLDPAETAEQRESVSLAMLLLLERLGPAERAVYVLREAFSYSHREIAQMLDLTEAASQQHLHRARERIGTVDREEPVDAAAGRRIIEAFLAAAASGRTERLVALLRDDATATGDGGPVPTIPGEYRGAERIAAYVRGVFKPTPVKRRLLGGAPAVHAAAVNGCPALVAVLDDRVVGVMAFAVVGGKIAAVRNFADPAKLAYLSRRWRTRAPEAPLIASW